MIMGFIQARMSSSRLPGKVLREIAGRPMLAHQLVRIRRASLIDDIVVTTSADAADDPVEQLCRDEGVKCFRGSLDDVLDRFYQCSAIYHPDFIVRLTGDCPLTDHRVIDATIGFFFAGGYDYVTNGGKQPTFPDGLDAEVFKVEALARAWQAAELPSEREHVTPYIKKHPEIFKLGVFRHEKDLSGLRWTVDEPADFDFVSEVYAALYENNPDFGMDDILGLLADRNELMQINSGIIRNAGYVKSLLIDKRAKR